MVIRITALVAFVAFLISPSALASNCHASKMIEKELSRADFSVLEINVLAGYLEIRPSKDDNIHFSGRACTSDKKWLEYITLDVDKKGDTLTLTLIIPYEASFFHATYSHVDVEVEVPANLATRVRDSSGDIHIEGVSVTSIDDSSGNILARNNLSELAINDSSGNIEIKKIRGNLHIKDSSGDINIRNVIGSVQIPRDSSGEIDIDTVSGSVNIGRDGSGGITIRDVSGDVEVGSDGSGNIKIRDIIGNVIIGNDGSGLLNIANVSGDLDVHAKGSGDISTRGIKGKTALPR